MPHNQAEVPPSVPAGVVEQVEAVLRRRLAGQVTELRVAMHAEGLVLQGRSRTHHAEQIAQHAASEISGIPILANEIRV